MEQRQQEVESKAPIIKTRLEDYRERLADLRISEAQYQELLSMPQEGLHVLDQVGDECFRVRVQHPGFNFQLVPNPKPKFEGVY